MYATLKLAAAVLLPNDNSSIHPSAQVHSDNISLSYCQHARETRELPSPFNAIATAEILAYQLETPAHFSLS